MNLAFQSIVPSAQLSEQVASALLAEIKAGRPEAGGKLPTEAVLAAQFAVSRTVIREAISRLKSRGMVESRQGSGVYVCKTPLEPLHFSAHSAASMQAVIQMVEVRRALEAEVAALAAERRSAQDVKKIQKSLAALDKAVKAGGDGAEEDVNFHRAIADAAHNPFLISTLDFLRQYLRGVTRVTRANEARSSDFSAQVKHEHMAIVCAIEAADPKKARAAATSHLSNAIERIKQADPAFWRLQGIQMASSLVHQTP